MKQTVLTLCAFCALLVGGTSAAAAASRGSAFHRAEQWASYDYNTGAGTISCHGPYANRRRQTQWACHGIFTSGYGQQEWQVNLDPYGAQTYHRLISR